MRSKEERIRQILEEYEQKRNHSLKAYLSNPTPASIKNYLVELMINQDLNEIDQSNLRSFLEIKKSDDLLKAIKKNTESFKPVQHFLLRKTQQTTKSSLIEVAEILVRTTEKKNGISSKKNESKEKKEGVGKKGAKKYWVSLLIVLGMVISIVVLTDNFSIEEKKDEVPEERKKEMLPVTKETVTKYFPPKNKDSIKRETIFNTTVRNSIEKKEIGVFVFDNLDKVDQVFTQQLILQLTNEYKPTAQLIETNKLTSEIISKLKSGSFNAFKGNIDKHVDYLCVGVVNYGYRKNTILKDQIVCDMDVNYSIFDVKDGSIIDAFSKRIIGYGVSQADAKTNTIQKFIL